MPGTIWTSPKTTSETPSRIGMAWSRRREAKRNISVHPFDMRAVWILAKRYASEKLVRNMGAGAEHLATMHTICAERRTFGCRWRTICLRPRHRPANGGSDAQDRHSSLRRRSAACSGAAAFICSTDRSGQDRPHRRRPAERLHGAGRGLPRSRTAREIVPNVNSISAACRAGRRSQRVPPEHDRRRRRTTLVELVRLFLAIPTAASAWMPPSPKAASAISSGPCSR